jgi:hypothetical protein
MAYMNQTMKSQIAPAIKAICKKYNVKASLSIKHHSSLNLTISSGSIDFIDNYNAVAKLDYTGRTDTIDRGYMSINQYHLDSHFTGTALACLTNRA